MEWCDVHGRVLPAAGPPETSRDREGCYTVTSHVIVPKTDNNTFTCRVQQPEIKHMKERRVHIPGTLDVSNAEPLMTKNKETTKNEEDEAGEPSLP
ncbi:unnamed protein product [Coregonus sp. 'balchen']|nr:unnamed protein product [Coregonus sp. 'balchen']